MPSLGVIVWCHRLVSSFDAVASILPRLGAYRAPTSTRRISIFGITVGAGLGHFAKTDAPSVLLDELTDNQGATFMLWFPIQLGAFCTTGTMFIFTTRLPKRGSLLFDSFI